MNKDIQEQIDKAYKIFNVYTRDYQMYLKLEDFEMATFFLEKMSGKFDDIQELEKGGKSYGSNNNSNTR